MKQYPLLRPLFAFVVGLVSVGSYIFDFKAIALLLFILLLLFVGIVIFRNKISYKYRWIKGVVVLLQFLIIGLLYKSAYNSFVFDIPQDDILSEKCFVVRLAEEPVMKKKSVKSTAYVELIGQSQFVNSKEKVLIYFKKDSLSENLKYGDKVAVFTTFRQLQAPLNPYEFDFRKHMLNKAVRNQAYVNADNWEILDRNKGSSLRSFAFDLRRNFMQIFENFGMDIHEMGVTTAILLGYDENLDPELSKYYTGAGISHILCVSGMHVGILMLLMSFFLSFLGNTKRGKIIRMIILMSFIWFYALITGLSPSVLRAATMFSFVIIGQTFNRKVSIYNSLLASFFLLVVIDPNVIFNVGFQLSYLAVFSIVWLQKPLYEIWQPKNKLLSYIWKLASVSIAAQILTTPITMFYFKQFPNYFLISNIVTPLISSVVMYLGIAVIIFSFIPYLSNALVWLLAKSVAAMNGVAETVYKMPGSLTTNIDISFESSMILYVAMILSLVFVFTKRKSFMWTALAVWIMFWGYISWDKYSDRNSNEMIFFSVNNESVIGIKTGEEMSIISSVPSDIAQTSLEFQLSNYMVKNRIKESNYSYIDSLNTTESNIYIDDNILHFGGNTILLLSRNNIRNLSLFPEFDFDYIYIYGNPYVDFSKFEDKFSDAQFIFATSNRPYRIEEWTAYCSEHGLKYINLHEGAYRVKL
ncbi:MAG: ComEC family competence protein [Bacteroidales bacterium]|jgi:competence protein ComEC|nr:ComEC family competence protein [Bacteroidales bacterium]